MNPDDPLDFCDDELRDLQQQGLRRYPHLLDGAQGPQVQINGRNYCSFASNSYLDLTTHKEVITAAQGAIALHGAGAGSARLVVGSMQPHRQLEQDLAAFKGTQDAVLFSSGYLANLALTSILRPGDAVFSDQLNHASIVDACRLAKANIHIFRHGDAEDADQQLRSWRNSHKNGRALLVTDSIFSMDGDLAPLNDLAQACARHDAMFMVDEAHATGTVGEAGQGAIAAARLQDKVHLLVGTLSKALASSGGFIAGRSALCELLRNKARSYMFDTAPAPSNVVAANKALEILRREPERVARLRRRTEELASGLDRPAPPAAILPIVVGAPERATSIAEQAFAAGLILPAIRPPAVPEGASRIRLTVTAGHDSGDVQRVIEFLRRTL